MKHNRLHNWWMGIGLTMIAAGFTGCSKEAVQSGNGEKSLSFVTLSKNIEGESRAAYTGEFGTTIYKANNIAELNQLTSADNSKIYDGIDNNKVLFRNGVWTTETDKYWPDAGGILVVAYSPYSNAGTNRVRMPYNMHSPYIYGDWQNNQTDLLFADVQWLTVKESSDSAIPVKFNHALAMLTVNISVASLSVGEDSWKMTLKSAELLKVPNHGAVTINNNGYNLWTTNNNGAWNMQTKSFETNLKYSGNVLLTSTPLKVIENKIVMPQHLIAAGQPNCQTLKVTYDLETIHKYKDEAGNILTQVQTDTGLVKEIPLYTQNITLWKMGQHITYNVIFNFSKPIQFEGSAQPWGNETIIQQ